MHNVYKINKTNQYQVTDVSSQFQVNHWMIYVFKHETLNTTYYPDIDPLIRQIKHKATGHRYKSSSSYNRQGLGIGPVFGKLASSLCNHVYVLQSVT